MRIACVGGGPAGLYFSILMKRRDAGHEITVYERDPAGQAYGWGVVFWDDLLRELHANDPPSAEEISARCFRWRDQLVEVHGAPTVNLGGSGYSIGRQSLLDILVRRASDLGVEVRFEREVEDPAELAGADLIVACDGAGSRLRRLRADRFKTNQRVGRNKYIWLGSTKVFDSFTFPFVRTAAGWIWFHAYGFDRETSTCVVECSSQTWAGLGFDRLDADQGLALLEQTFERHLDGHPLIGRTRGGEQMPWLSFQTLANRSWHDGRIVLMGDAAHTTHFTIGSGTCLAIEDAIALASRLQGSDPLEEALRAYEVERRAALVGPQRDACYSERWFENVPRYIDLEAPEFAALLNLRFSRALARLPPRAYLRLERAAKRLPGLGRLRG